MVDEILYQGKYLSIRKKEGWYEYMHDRTGKLVGLFVFTKNGFGDVSQILGRYEYDVRTGKHKLTSVTGGVEENQTPIQAAIMELHEEAGYDVQEQDLIDLGTMTLTKSDDSVMYLYAYDATGKENLRRKDSISDGTKGEEGAYCDWVDADKIVEMQNPVNAVALLRVLDKEVKEKEKSGNSDFNWSLDAAVRLLNDCLKTDNFAINKLFSMRVPVNSALAGHPTVTVANDNTLSVLGLLNGFLSTDEQALAISVDDDSSIEEFVVLDLKNQGEVNEK
jgi:8-oxo-dGTP pyrophosphatase MutT (NUDIX family)